DAAGEPRDRGVSGVHAAHVHAAGEVSVPVVRDQSVEGLAQGGLRGAVAADHRHEVAPLDREVDVAQRVAVGARVAEGQVLHDDRRRGGRRGARGGGGRGGRRGGRRRGAGGGGGGLHGAAPGGGGVAVRRSGQARSAASRAFCDRRNSSSDSPSTSTNASTETSRNQSPKRSRKSGSKAPAETSNASRNAKPKLATDSSSMAPRNSGVRGARPGTGSPGTRGRMPISGSIFPCRAGISHRAGIAPSRIPDISTSTPRPSASSASIDSGRPATNSASSTPIHTFDRSTTAERILSTSTSTIAPSTICGRERGERIREPAM